MTAETAPDWWSEDRSRVHPHRPTFDYDPDAHAWHADAACHASLFPDDRFDPGSANGQAFALQVCADCPVRTQCRATIQRRRKRMERAKTLAQPTTKGEATR